MDKEKILEDLYDAIIREMAEVISNEMISKALEIYDGIHDGAYRLIDKDGEEVSV